MSRDGELSTAEIDVNGGPANIVDGLFAIARALGALSRAIDRLGTGNAATDMGALEVLAGEVRTGFGAIASAISETRDS